MQSLIAIGCKLLRLIYTILTKGETVRKLNSMQSQQQDIGKKVGKSYNMEYAETEKRELSDSLRGEYSTPKTVWRYHSARSIGIIDSISQ